ncbi:MAG TPA: hypothetical protein VJI74_00395 [Candidatus Paceibacterota bacterium]
MISLLSVLPRVIAAALFAGVLSGTWDAWWHGALGRESFWSPPHMFLYASILVAIACGLYGWRKNRDKLWRNLALLLVLVPASAPFDEFWHRMFGVENVSTPLIIWSPPHLMLVGAILGSFLMLLPILRRDEDPVARRLFGAMSFAGILTLLFFLASPLEPTGPHRILGFWGAAVTGFFLAATFLSSQRWMDSVGGAVLTAAFFILLQAVGFGERISSRVVITPHEHPPSWIVVFSLLVPAALIDTARRLPWWVRGGGVGFLWGTILYGFTSSFFEPQFQYPLSDALTAIVATTIAGLAAGIVFSSREKNAQVSV